MRFDSAPVEEMTSSCNRETFPISSAVSATMSSIPKRAARAVAIGLLITIVQLTLAVVLLAPEGPIGYRYSTLVQHDSYWFANIVNRGYQTIVPPINHKVMEVSNVAFFPAYPLLAAALHYGLGL